MSDEPSEEGRKGCEAAEEARCLSGGPSVPPLPEKPTATARAGQILRDALERYRRPDGYEGDLVEAAWQLEQIGREAWPVLRELASASVPECEYFLATMVRLQGVPAGERRQVLLAGARNPDANS